MDVDGWLNCFLRHDWRRQKTDEKLQMIVKFQFKQRANIYAPLLSALEWKDINVDDDYGNNLLDERIEMKMMMTLENKKSQLLKSDAGGGYQQFGQHALLS